MILAVVSLFTTLSLSAAAAPVTATTTLPAGQTSFSIDLRVNESTPYATIEFALTINDGSALTFESFTSTLSGATTSPFVEKGGKQYFGFYTLTGANVFPTGDTLVGRLNFTGYTGSQAVTISIDQMKVTRIDEQPDIDGNKKSTTTEKESPAYVFTVVRAGTTYYTVNFITGGGTRTGGGALIQVVPAGGAAIAPTLTRSGYTFSGWDSAFTNVTSNITVTAQWTPSGGGTNPPPPSGEIIDDDGPPLANPHYFDDVDETNYSWALVAVDALAEADVIQGTSYRIYSPAANIKRGDSILGLARIYDLDAPFTVNFPDVPTGSYYYDAIGSARALDIVGGYSDGSFHPDSPLTRQDMMVQIDHTLQILGKPLPRGSESDLALFSDQGKVSGYARAAVAALIKSGIVEGSGVGIDPLGYTTRAQMAVLLYKLMNLIED